MAANRMAGVKKKQKYTVNFYLILLSKSYKLNSTKRTNNKVSKKYLNQRSKKIS